MTVVLKEEFKTNADDGKRNRQESGNASALWLHVNPNIDNVLSAMGLLAISKGETNL